MNTDVIVEIPKGSRNKYEFDPEAGRIRFNRMLFSSVHYPCDYGYFPDTLAEDGDPLDALILVHEPTFPGCIIEIKPVGILRMRDRGERDNKVLCVPVTDPRWNHIKKLDDVPQSLLNEVEHFFKVYKNLEKKKVKISGWGDKKEALAAFHKSVKRYERNQRKSV